MFFIKKINMPHMTLYITLCDITDSHVDRRKQKSDLTDSNNMYWDRHLQTVDISYTVTISS